jgi:hypothetical protein
MISPQLQEFDCVRRSQICQLEMDELLHLVMLSSAQRVQYKCAFLPGSCMRTHSLSLDGNVDIVPQSSQKEPRYYLRYQVYRLVLSSAIWVSRSPPGMTSITSKVCWVWMLAPRK